MIDLSNLKTLSPVETAQRLRAYIMKAMDIIDDRKDNSDVLKQGMERIEAYKAAEEAVNKQISKKLVRNDVNNLCCPTCMSPMVVHFSYCPNCGQAWEGAEAYDRSN